MSCNGCRVLRKGCSEACVLRPALQWIENPDAQGHATQFLAKKVGRSGLMESIKKAPPAQRPSIFQSLLYEACGRAVEPALGIAGLVFSGNVAALEAAVETVLRCGALPPSPVPSLVDQNRFPSFEALALKMGCRGIQGRGAVSPVATIRSERKRSSVSSEGLSTTATANEKGDVGIKRGRGKVSEVVQNAMCGVPFNCEACPSPPNVDARSRGRSEASGDSESLADLPAKRQDWPQFVQLDGGGHHQAVTWQQWQKFPQFAAGTGLRPNPLVPREASVGLPVEKHRMMRPPKQEPGTYHENEYCTPVSAPTPRRIRPRLVPTTVGSGFEAPTAVKIAPESGECDKLELDLTLSTSAGKTCVKRIPRSDIGLGSPSSESANSGTSETCSFEGPGVHLSLSQVNYEWMQNVSQSPSPTGDCHERKLLTLFREQSP